MARPRVFISSTFYDLRQVRYDVDAFVEALGYEPVRNEEGDIPYGKDDILEEYCYKEIKNVDIFISIIGGRYGSDAKRGKSSISQMELKTAQRENKQVYVFIEKNVLSEYETYLLNRHLKEAKYKYVDDLRIYEFIEEIRNLNINNIMKEFETVADITKYLKEQFAGLFQRLLDEQTRIKEISVIRNLEKTAETLNKLVNFLSDENKGQTEEINRILMINHPLVESLRTILEIPYNFYIEGKSDLAQLLGARGYKEDVVMPWDVVNKASRWIKASGRSKSILNISDEIFDEDGKLRFVKRTDWKESFVELTVDDEKVLNDLPF